MCFLRERRGRQKGVLVDFSIWRGGWVELCEGSVVILSVCDGAWGRAVPVEAGEVSAVIDSLEVL